MKPLNPNSMIQGRYLVVQSIGKGGMGEVYLAVDQRLGSAVALKRTFFSEDSTLGAAFEREARILARLRHPVLPKVIDHFAENGDQFLVMEHISGDDISKRLETSKKPFPVSWVMFWADQMLDALAYLHSHEPPIVHRDIKPQNLKLTDDNHIVLLDFGLSKDFDSSSSDQNSASVAGYSPHFASMEQIRGTGTDARSDLYSLSATLYQMLTNTIPLDALTRADALLGGKSDPILPLNELNPEISTAISEVILKGVAIRQDERFSTALEMQKTLRRAFNKGKPDPDAKPVMSTSNPNKPPADTSPPKPETGSVESAMLETVEMDTRVREATPAPLDATMELDAKSVAAEIKQSELQTAVFSPASLEDDHATIVSTPEPAGSVDIPVAKAAAAAGSIGAADPPSSLSGAALKSADANKTPALHKSGKKSSKAGLVIGVLVGLLFLTVLGGGAGYYLITRSNAVVPPAPIDEPSPTPAVLTENDQTVNSNTETLSESTTNSNISNSEVSTTTTPDKTVVKSTPQTPKETPVRAAKTPTVKETPKGKAKDDRTIIMP